MTAQPLPTVALSILQPWAWLIVNGYKDIENRTWRTHRRGPILVHTGKGFDSEAHDLLRLGIHPTPGMAAFGCSEIQAAYQHALETHQVQRGGIVGVTTITGCVSTHGSLWFCGPYGFTLADARPLPFMPLSGARGFFPTEYVAPEGC
ncbi:ASCH domain-containing protein [Caulobacter sp. SL161]|uniref:ASCH domain-containing protein n=1 Tax=Caulobacter sp. SL161 TaxID=2995156 RepID=UPI0022724E90|nr:ASCH domain-containing protein [Caulobacter sp. SL161]MCY1649115.1 ASCH domain-containing protein [Caulobacter sp. SL161]